jgi:hypothetical protein
MIKKLFILTLIASCIYFVFYNLKSVESILFLVIIGLLLDLRNKTNVSLKNQKTIMNGIKVDLATIRKEIKAIK